MRGRKVTFYRVISVEMFVRFQYSACLITIGWCSCRPPCSSFEAFHQWFIKHRCTSRLPDTSPHLVRIQHDYWTFQSRFRGCRGCGTQTIVELSFDGCGQLVSPTGIGEKQVCPDRTSKTGNNSPYATRILSPTQTCRTASRRRRPRRMECGCGSLIAAVGSTITFA